MTEEHDAPTPGESADDQIRRLELELVKIRNEAAAARLEARAAEIELMIRQLAHSGDAKQCGLPIYPPYDRSGPSPGTLAFASWDDVRNAATRNGDADSLPSGVPLITAGGTNLPQGDPSSGGEAESGGDNSFGRDNSFEVDGADDDSVTECDRTAPQFQSDGRRSAAIGSPAIDSQSDGETITRVDPRHRRMPAPSFDLTADESGDRPDSDESSATDVFELFAIECDESGDPPRSADPNHPDANAASLVAEVPLDRGDEESDKRSKPAAWLVSAVSHVVVLFVLAAVTLQTARPKDQVSLSASTPEANEVAMETFSIESSEPETDPVEATPSETEYELSPIGELAVADFVPDSPPATPMAQAISSALSSSAAAMSVTSESDAKIEFCGVEGGGNHFVYLVDSSGSMGDGFESARSELLRSIEVLKPEQRFYVVFFDAESDYMRLADPTRDESQSVNATAANKSALSRWAMRISKDRGKASYDPLRFALRLRPDVVFLLSDGEFPQGIEDLLLEENKVENLFGESKPIAIVHTISYHSKEGESRMRRIAQQNQGQYRHIPKP